jgi:glycosyltransferase involved in cell wall biosynthesis
MVPADEVEGFAHALTLLLKDDALRQKMGENAYNITIPYFTWSNMVERFLKTIDFEIPEI